MTPAWPVSVDAVSPVSCGSVLWGTGGRRFVTFIVKATFELTHEKPATLTSPLAILREDTAQGPSDLAPYLPNVGVMVKGHAIPPGGRPAQAMSVRVAVYRDGALLDKTLHVFGDRPPGASGPGAGATFTKMALVWERARASATDNPVGMAASPNVVDPRREDAPAGFGPIPRAFPVRRQRLGATPAERVDGALPDLPMGFDWRYFQAAPRDQQLRPLRGDEWIVLDGFHADLPRIQTRLPAAKAFARITRAGQPPRVQSLMLDTIFIDVDRRLLVLVHRDHIPVEHKLSELQVQAGIELPDTPISWPSEPARPPVKSASPSLTGTLTMPAMPVPKDPLPFNPAAAPPPPPPPRLPPPDPIRTGTLEIDLRKFPNRAIPFPGSAPLVVSEPAPPPAEKEAEAPAPRQPTPPPPPLLGPVHAEPEPEPAKQPKAPPPAPPRDEALRARVIKHIRASEPLTDLPLRGADLSDLDLGGAVLAGCDLQGTYLSRATLDDARLAGADLRGAVLAEATLVMADLSFANLRGAFLVSAKLDHARLGSADLTGAEGTSASFVAASAARAAFAKGSWEGAVFDELTAEGADFAGASLEGASLRGASIPEARLSDAHGAAIFDGAKMSGARGAGAKLSDSSFAGADLARSQWTSAELERASFTGATMTNANLRRARCEAATFEGADLTSADLEHASCERANLKDATLDGAGLRHTRLSEATLQGAKVRGAMAYKCDLSDADLGGADFEGTNLRSANLRGAKLERAKLEAADLRGAIKAPASAP